MTIKLIFSKKRHSQGPIILKFGGDEEAPPITHLINARISIDDLSVKASINNDYGINERAISKLSASLFSETDVVNYHIHDLFENSDNINNDSDSIWNDSAKRGSLNFSSWENGDNLRNDESSQWGTAQNVQALAELFFDSTNSTKIDDSSKWGASEALSAKNSGYSSNAVLLDNKNSSLFESAIARISKDHEIITIYARKEEEKEHSRWGVSVYPHSGKSEPIDWDFEWHPEKPIHIQRTLKFCHELEHDQPIKLVFGKKCGAVIKDRGTYLINNKVSVIRTDNNEEVEVYDVTVNIDRESFAWVGSISLHGKEAEKLKDKPEIEININHLKWKMDVVFPDKSTAFNSSRVTISCISSANRLSKIPATPVLEDATAQNIAARQVYNVGLDTKYDVEWAAVDWSIPSGLIDFYGKKSLDVIAEITEAVGAILTADYYEHKIIARNRYDQYHWNELTPVLVVPLDVLVGHDETEEETESIDSIVVSGVDMGVTANVRRFGFDGSRPGEMKVDRLITEERAARARGATEINQTGNKQFIKASMPLVKEIGYHYPAEIAQIADKKGYIDAIEVSARSENGVTIVRYNLTIEHHKNDAF